MSRQEGRVQLHPGLVSAGLTWSPWGPGPPPPIDLAPALLPRGAEAQLCQALFGSQRTKPLPSARASAQETFYSLSEPLQAPPLLCREWINID